MQITYTKGLVNEFRTELNKTATSIELVIGTTLCIFRTYMNKSIPIKMAKSTVTENAVLLSCDQALSIMILFVLFSSNLPFREALIILL